MWAVGERAMYNTIRNNTLQRNISLMIKEECYVIIKFSLALFRGHHQRHLSLYRLDRVGPPPFLVAVVFIAIHQNHHGYRRPTTPFLMLRLWLFLTHLVVPPYLDLDWMSPPSLWYCSTRARSSRLLLLTLTIPVCFQIVRAQTDVRIHTGGFSKLFCFEEKRETFSKNMRAKPQGKATDMAHNSL